MEHRHLPSYRTTLSVNGILAMWISASSLYSSSSGLEAAGRPLNRFPCSADWNRPPGHPDAWWADQLHQVNRSSRLMAFCHNNETIVFFTGVLIWMHSVSSWSKVWQYLFVLFSAAKQKENLLIERIEELRHHIRIESAVQEGSQNMLKQLKALKSVEKKALLEVYRFALSTVICVAQWF